MGPRVDSARRPSPPAGGAKAEPTPHELGAAVIAAHEAEGARIGAKTMMDAAKLVLDTAPPKLKATRQKQYDAARAAYEKAQTKASDAESQVRQLVADVAGPKLAKKTERLHTMYETTLAARDAQKPGSKQWKALDAAVKELGTRLEARQTDNLEKSRWNGKTEAESNLDGLTDLASRTRDEQIRLAGAPVVNVSEDQAVSFDRRKVSIASRGVYPASGAQMLTMQLEGASPAAQSKLIKSISDPKRDHLQFLVDKAKTDPMVAQGLAKAVATAKSPAREELITLIAKHVSGADHALLTHVGGGASFGQNIEFGAALTKALQKAGKSKEAGALMGATADSLGALRKEFLAAKKKVDAHNAEFAKTVTGFAAAVDPKKLEAYRARFMESHKADYDAFNASAGKYMEAFKAAHTSAYGELNAMPYLPEGRLRAELENAGVKYAADILGTPAGQKELDRALQQQLADKNSKSWLDSLSSVADAGSKVKDRIELPSKLADFTARAMVRIAASSGDVTKVNALVAKNAKLLGITADKVEGFQKLITEINDPALTTAQRLDAFKRGTREISGGEYGPKDGKAVKALGLLLAGPGIVNGWINIGDKTALQQVSHAVETLGFGNELVSLFTDTKVLGKVLGAAGAGLSVVKGIGALADGKLLEGGTSIASGIGAGLMLVPGGQLAGAALVLGSALANLIWGDDPEAEAEAAQEKKVREFLVEMGVKPEIAKELGDVLQSNHRSMGPFVEQMANELKMKPSEFLEFLNGKKPAEVRALVQVVKNMPTDKNWNFQRKRTDPIEDQPYVRHISNREETFDMRPASFETLKEWMKTNGMWPPQAK